MHDLLKPVIEKLQKEGATEEQIANTIADLTQTATVRLYQRAMEVMSEEDLQKIENCATDEEADQLIMKLYTEKSETTPQQLLEVFLKEFVKEFLSTTPLYSE